MAAGEEMVRRMYDAFNARDVDAVLECLTPDFELRPLIGHTEGSVYRGHAGVRRWMTEDMPETWIELYAHPEQIIETGDRLLVLVRNEGRGASSGARVEQRVAHILRLQDGVIAELTAVPDRSEALESLGLDRTGDGSAG